MTEVRLNFEKRTFILNCYWKAERIIHLRRQLRMEFQRDEPMALTITRLQCDETVRNVQQSHFRQDHDRSPSLHEKEKALKI